MRILSPESIFSHRFTTFEEEKGIYYYIGIIYFWAEGKNIIKLIKYPFMSYQG